MPVGRADVGFLPGGLDEKLDPWMSAIHDAIVALTDQRSSRDARTLIDELTTRNQLSLESVTFLRGRSLHRQMVIVDEAQNLEPTTLKTILTRIGEGTKVVFTGDTSQIDAPYLGESNNALAVLIQAFGGQPCFGHVTLVRVRAQRRRQPRRRAALIGAPIGAGDPRRTRRSVAVDGAVVLPTHEDCGCLALESQSIVIEQRRTRVGVERRRCRARRRRAWKQVAACKGRTALFFPHRKAERPQARARREAKARRLCHTLPRAGDLPGVRPGRTASTASGAARTRRTGTSPASPSPRRSGVRVAAS